MSESAAQRVKALCYELVAAIDEAGEGFNDGSLLVAEAAMLQARYKINLLRARDGVVWDRTLDGLVKPQPPEGMCYCKSCERLLELTKEFFHGDAQGKTGFKRKCKDCSSRKKRMTAVKRVQDEEEAVEKPHEKSAKRRAAVRGASTTLVSLNNLVELAEHASGELPAAVGDEISADIFTGPGTTKTPIEAVEASSAPSVPSALPADIINDTINAPVAPVALDAPAVANSAKSSEATGKTLIRRNPERNAKQSTVPETDGECGKVRGGLLECAAGMCYRKFHWKCAGYPRKPSFDSEYLLHCAECLTSDIGIGARLRLWQLEDEPRLILDWIRENARQYEFVKIVGDGACVFNSIYAGLQRIELDRSLVITNLEDLIRGVANGCIDFCNSDEAETYFESGHMNRALAAKFWSDISEKPGLIRRGWTDACSELWPRGMKKFLPSIGIRIFSLLENGSVTSKDHVVNDNESASVINMFRRHLNGNEHYDLLRVRNQDVQQCQSLVFRTGLPPDGFATQPKLKDYEMDRDGFDVYKNAFVLPESMLEKLEEHARDDNPVWKRNDATIFNNGD